MKDRLVYVISDNHFGHEKCCTVFTRNDGSPLRSFKDADEMDEAMVQRYNAIVRPQDKVYFLGDVCINKKSLAIISRLMGHKRLIGGNHDIHSVYDYLDAGFEEVRGVRVFRANRDEGMPDCVMTHVPIHPDCLARWGVNVHGHLHANILRDQNGHADPRYVSACVEMIDYTPILLTELVKRAGKQIGDTYKSTSKDD